MNRATCCRDRRSVGFPFWTSLYRQADQIRRDLRNAGERGVRVVLFANAEELNRKDHSAASLRATTRTYELIHNANELWQK